MKTRTCHRCGKELKRPIPEYAHYVIANDTKTTRTKESIEIKYEKTNGKTVTKRGISISAMNKMVQDKEIKQIIDQKIVQEPEITDGTGLVCKECTKETDRIIW